MTELKKCPFSGGEANIESYDPYDGYQGDCTVWRVKCLECKIIIQRGTKEKANLRHGRQFSKEITCRFR